MRGICRTARALLVALPSGLALPRPTPAGVDRRPRLGSTEAGWIARLHKPASRGPGGTDIWSCCFASVTTRLSNGW
jgi:hypothetical protein